MTNELIEADAPAETILGDYGANNIQVLEGLEAVRKRPAAHPEIIATSSEKGLGLPELRTAVYAAVTR